MSFKSITLSIIIPSLSFLLLACDGGSSSNSEPDVSSEEFPEVAFMANEIPADASIDVELVELVQSFLKEADQREVKVDLSGFTIGFGDLNEEAIGVCFFVEKEIIIENEFRNADQAELYEILIHELGHCALGMEHRPNSLMQAEGFIGVSTVLLNEFFNERYFYQLREELSAAKYR